MCFILCRLNSPRNRVISLTATCRRDPYSASTLYDFYILTTKRRVSPSAVSNLRTPEPEWVRAAQLQVLLLAASPPARMQLVVLLLAASPPARMQLVVVLLLIVLLVVLVVAVVADHHLRTSPLAVAMRPVSKGSFSSK